ncbi:hypothetical protein J3Q64DRAFT_1713244 [Phycomyces blakesleeanus]|uniref:Uncharacterized protein n=2 Tax=Phycomyces blakesleeanus TaxID=4837 RepID=A0A167Q687_PHYB8|nr:hypothetical protein PHYBLDRAFT_58193 [Phycomyces blakesleeanus NRRL 1555(-)]OAD79144.1 hypothetical protein PHYBLDRAFT_58193 [Phycomyces blakesleeanus NRRL 1555(-)]|eukprot:XP_018297184.1 hypothetical protein PHYBLDRAFT_58193 [Phycomyces blakesleeanus NRRL 1555(-)]
MHTPKTSHDLHNESSSNTEHPHTPSEERDPILLDDHFSLQYGNPIEIIHDAPKHAVDTFEPSKDHLPPDLIGHINTVPCQDCRRDPHQKRQGSQRDHLACSEFYHVNGVVEEK